MASTAGVKAGKAFVIIEALDKTSQGLKGIHNKLRQFGSDVANIGSNLLMKSLIALAPVGLSVKTFIDFDDSMRKVEARSEGTAKQLDALREKAKALGRETAFTSAQIAELQSKIAQKGFSRSEILNMTGPITALARAAGEGIDLTADATTAATLVGSTLRSFQMEAKDTAKIADLITTTVNGSNYTMEELGNTLQFVGPEAKAFNQSLEETLAMAASLRDLGIDASIVGTSMRNMFTYMSKASHQDEFNATLQELTGNTIKFNKANGDLNSLPDLLVAIGKATSSLGTAERSNILSEMFGTRVVVSAGAMGRNAAAYNKMLFKLMNQSSGVAQKQMDQMEAGLGGGFRELLSSIEAVGLSIGEALAPPLAIIAKIIDKLAKLLSVWILQNKWVVLTIVAAIVAVGLFGAALLLLGVTISAVASLVASLGILLSVVSGVLTVVLSPVFLIVAALALLAIGIGLAIYLFGDLLSIAGMMGGALDTLGINFGALSAIIAGTIASLSHFFRVYAAVANAIKSNDLATASELVWAQLVVIWTAGTNSIMSLWDQIVTGGRAAILLLQIMFVSFIQYLIQIFNGAIAAITVGLTGLITKASSIAEAIGGKIGIAMQIALSAAQVGVNATAPALAMDPKSLDDSDLKAKLFGEFSGMMGREVERANKLSVAQQARDALLAKAEGLKPEDAENIDDYLKGMNHAMDKRADELIGRGPPGGTLPGKALQGLDVRTIEGMKSWIENRTNDPLAVAKEHLGVAKEAKAKLDDIDEGLREMKMGGV